MKSKFTDKWVKTLLGLGLSRTQMMLYLASLQHGILSVLELSKITGISRQQIYEEAEKLVKLGLYEITRRQRRKYLPANPLKLLKMGRRRIEETEELLSELSSLLPQFEALSVPKRNKVITKYYEGLDKIREAYEDELEVVKNTEVVSFAGSIDDIFQFFPESYWNKWNKRFVKNNSRSRMLVHNSDTARITAQYDREYKRETRYLHNFPLKVNIDVFNNIVLVVSFYDEIAIWIESHMLSQSYRIMFNALWGLAKPFE